MCSNVKLTNNPETAGRYHSNWLNMMYPRLKLARNLLSDEGVIFINIGNIELNNIKKICDEVFGEDNFLANITRKSIAGGSKSDSKYFIFDNDYILVYSKNLFNVVLNKIYKKNCQKYDKKDDIGEFKLRALEMQGSNEDTLENRPKMGYSIYYHPLKNDYVLLHDYDLTKKENIYEAPLKKLVDDGYICIRPRCLNGRYGRWRWSKEKFLNNLSEIFIDVDKKRVFTKDRKKEFIESSPNCNITCLNTKGTVELRNLFDSKIFDFPKPISLIQHLIKIGTGNDGIILDFFSGSATTAHAVMDLNAENGGNRKFIMVQIPEVTDEKSEAYKVGYKNICEIGKERIRRAGDKILKESENKDLDIGFKVFKLDSSNLDKWDPDYDDLQQSLYVDNIKPDRTNEDLIYEIMLKSGIDLTYPIEKENDLYIIGYGALVICLDDNITKEIADEIVKLKDKYGHILRVVFKDNGFKSDSDKTNIKEILNTNKIEEFITI